MTTVHSLLSPQLSVPKDKPWSHWKEAIHHDISWCNYSLETRFSSWGGSVLGRALRKHSWTGFVFLVLLWHYRLLFQGIHFLYVPAFGVGNFNLFKKTMMKMLIDTDLRDHLLVEPLAVDLFPAPWSFIIFWWWGCMDIFHCVDSLATWLWEPMFTLLTISPVSSWICSNYTLRLYFSIKRASLWL